MKIIENGNAFLKGWFTAGQTTPIVVVMIMKWND
jgi:hypothetical protein